VAALVSFGPGGDCKLSARTAARPWAKKRNHGVSIEEPLKKTFCYSASAAILITTKTATFDAGPAFASNTPEVVMARAVVLELLRSKKKYPALLTSLAI